jgi:Flp pilus assembly pilin Flp
MTIYQLARMVITNQKGQGMAEYSLILTLVAAVTVAGFTLLGGNVLNVVGNVGGQIATP